jgi:hypothetical protein
VMMSGLPRFPTGAIRAFFSIAAESETNSHISREPPDLMRHSISSRVAWCRHLCFVQAEDRARDVAGWRRSMQRFTGTFTEGSLCLR